LIFIFIKFEKIFLRLNILKKHLYNIIFFQNLIAIFLCFFVFVSLSLFLCLCFFVFVSLSLFYSTWMIKWYYSLLQWILNNMKRRMKYIINRYFQIYYLIKLKNIYHHKILMLILLYNILYYLHSSLFNSEIIINI
jgi:hypothetical protein